jgi:hypothetical protein
VYYNFSPKAVAGLAYGGDQIMGASHEYHNKNTLINYREPEKISGRKYNLNIFSSDLININYQYHTKLTINDLRLKPTREIKNNKEYPYVKH